jgi:dTDP-4-dehydrorhamnose reductase
MRILLIGSAGQLGSDLIKNNPGHQIIAPKRSELDLASSEMINDVIRETRPDWVINAAAFHNVALCEEQSEQAFRVNCIAVRDLAQACRVWSARLMTFSTDYVFSGEKRTPYLEIDCPAPLQVYGITKLAGERAAQAVAREDAVIVRTCGLYGETGSASKGTNFVDNRVRDGLHATPIEISNDQTVCPTSADDLSKAVYALLASSASISGIYHLTSEGECTWFEFTKAIYEYLGFGAELHAVDRQGLSGMMRRPLYSVLANVRARAVGVTLPRWQDALEKYLNNKYPGQGRGLIRTQPLTG